MSLTSTQWSLWSASHLVRMSTGTSAFHPRTRRCFGAKWPHVTQKRRCSVRFSRTGRHLVPPRVRLVYMNLGIASRWRVLPVRGSQQQTGPSVRPPSPSLQAAARPTRQWGGSATRPAPRDRNSQRTFQLMSRGARPPSPQLQAAARSTRQRGADACSQSAEELRSALARGSVSRRLAAADSCAGHRLAVAEANGRRVPVDRCGRDWTMGPGRQGQGRMDEGPRSGGVGATGRGAPRLAPPTARGPNPTATQAHL